MNRHEIRAQARKDELRAQARKAARERGQGQRHIHAAQPRYGEPPGCECHERAADAASDVWEEAARKSVDRLRRILHDARRRAGSQHREPPARLLDDRILHLAWDLEDVERKLEEALAELP